MKIFIKNESKHPLPEYQTEGSSGADLRANLEEPVTLKPLERRLIPTGIFLEIPKGYEVQIRPRSGLSIKKGITLVNAVGTIDSDYRGELKVPLINLSNEEYTVTDGERICQMVLAETVPMEFILRESLENTERGEGGFGHTGEN